MQTDYTAATWKYLGKTETVLDWPSTQTISSIVECESEIKWKNELFGSLLKSPNKHFSQILPLQFKYTIISREMFLFHLTNSLYFNTKFNCSLFSPRQSSIFKCTVFMLFHIYARPFEIALHIILLTSVILSHRRLRFNSYPKRQFSSIVIHFVSGWDAWVNLFSDKFWGGEKKAHVFLHTVFI